MGVNLCVAATREYTVQYDGLSTSEGAGYTVLKSYSARQEGISTYTATSLIMQSRNGSPTTLTSSNILTYISPKSVTGYQTSVVVEGNIITINYSSFIGKVVTIKGKITNGDGETKEYYLKNNDLSMAAINAATTGTTPDYSYYWVISKDPDGEYCYFSSLKGDGYIGKGKGISYSTGETKDAIPICTDNYQKEFQFLGFHKQGEINTTDRTNEIMDGYALYINIDGSTEGYRYVAISEEGDVNWMDYTSKGTNNVASNGKYWSTDFTLTEVTHTEERESYGTFDTPTYFGFPVKFTRHDDNYKANSYEDYNRYATLKLPFAVTLDDGIKVWKIESLDPTPGSQVKLTEYTLTDNVLPRETPVLLGIDGTQYDGNVTETRYFKPALAQEIKETGFSGTLGKKTFSGYNGYRGSGNTGDYGDTYYILSKEDGRVAFRYLLGNEITNNKAYYVYKASGTAAPSMITFSFGSKETTGMEKSIAVETEDNGNIYDLFGRKAGNTDRKGIYIKNGKKFVVK